MPSTTSIGTFSLIWKTSRREQLRAAAVGERTARHPEHIKNIAPAQPFSAKKPPIFPVLREKSRDLRRFERHATAALEHRAVSLLAWRAVVDAAAVAAIEPGFGTESPNRVLDEPWEAGGERGIEAARIDVAGDALDDRGAA